MCLFLLRDGRERIGERERETENDCRLFTLRFFRGCFLPGKQSAGPVNCLLTWAYNTAEGLGWAGLGRANERDGGRRQVYIKKNALISLFAEGG